MKTHRCSPTRSNVRHIIPCKVSANRAKNKIKKAKSFLFHIIYSEIQPNFIHFPFHCLQSLHNHYAEAAQSFVTIVKE